MAEAAPKPAWSLKRGLVLFRPADQSGPTASVTATRSRIEAFMRHWDDKAAVWSSVVPGGDKPWTGRIDFPGESGDEFRATERRPVVVYEADVLVSGAIHGATVPLLTVPFMDHRGDSVEVARNGSMDYWQFLGHPDGDSQDVPRCSLWRFLKLANGFREEIHVLFKRKRGVKENRVHNPASTEAETRDRVQRDVVAFLRALGGPVEFRGVRFEPEDVEIVDLPTAPSAPPALSVTLRGIWRPVRRDVTETDRGTRRFGQEVTRPDGYLRWAFVLPGGEADPREGHEPVRIKGRGNRFSPTSSSSSQTAQWSLLSRQLGRHHRLTKTTWTLRHRSSSSPLASGPDGAAAGAAPTRVVFEVEDAHEPRARGRGRRTRGGGAAGLEGTGGVGGGEA